MKCSFWYLAYLEVFYENKKSEGRSYVFKVFEKSSPCSSQDAQKDQYLNISHLSELIKQAQEKAKRTRLLDKNNQNKVDNYQANYLLSSLSV